MIRKKDRQVSALTAVVAILVLAFVGLIIYDKLNPDVGWFRDTLTAIGVSMDLSTFL